MSKNKLQKFSEMEHFERVFQPDFRDVYGKDHPLKGNWARDVFGNEQPIVLELGCGKGEYTLGLARLNPEINYIGIDIKGARIWRGAKAAHEEGIPNVAFLRTRIEFIESFFAQNEVQQIWITFPDPQIKKRRNKKRLTGPRFLTHYQTFLLDGGSVHLKTDSDILYHYTLALVRHNSLETVVHTDDLYHSEWADEIRSIKTFYENQFLVNGENINYLHFRLPRVCKIEDLPEDDV